MKRRQAAIALLKVSTETKVWAEKSGGQHERFLSLSGDSEGRRRKIGM